MRDNDDVRGAFNRDAADPETITAKALRLMKVESAVGVEPLRLLDAVHVAASRSIFGTHESHDLAGSFEWRWLASQVKPPSFALCEAAALNRTTVPVIAPDGRQLDAFVSEWTISFNAGRNWFEAKVNLRVYDA
jgi:hypothetical protein